MELNLPYFKSKLEKRYDELNEIIESSIDSVKIVELDQSKIGRLSRMDALQGQAMALETNRRRKNEILRINSALERIKSNDFGFCLSCDEPIGIKRLELDPSIPNCINCAK